jgi:hypothetical protein
MRRVGVVPRVVPPSLREPEPVPVQEDQPGFKGRGRGVLRSRVADEGHDQRPRSEEGQSLRGKLASLERGRGVAQDDDDEAAVRGNLGIGK